jgi:enoyl-CoA hydratase
MTQDVLVDVSGRVGRIRLNRPRALNALDLPMCRTMLDALSSWAEDPAIDLVMIDHVEGRGFCAGGDIRMLSESGARDGVEAERFFFTEYQLNHLLFRYAKPTVAFMDGITMGGGVGISLPCRYRVATERTRFAMPESGIGLFPDVGAGWYLSRLPGAVGAWLALTGAQLSGADCVDLGLATDYVETDRLGDLKQALIDGADPSSAVSAKSSVPSKGLADTVRADIDRLFAEGDYADILARLSADGGAWARAQRDILARKSNLTCKVALRQLAESRQLTDFADEMRMEYRIAARMCRSSDFREGVRALLIDKDQSPIWHPATPEGVSREMIDAIFAPLGDGAEWFPATAPDRAVISHRDELKTDGDRR